MSPRIAWPLVSLSLFTTLGTSHMVLVHACVFQPDQGYPGDTQAYLCPSFPMQLCPFQCPALQIPDASTAPNSGQSLCPSRTAVLEQSLSCYTAARKLFPGEEQRRSLGSPHEFAFSQDQNAVLSVDQDLKRVTSYILSSFVIVYCRRTGLLTVIAKIGSPPLKHSFLTYVHF